MPDNLDEPSHVSMREVAASGAWAAKIGDPAALRPRVLSAAEYYDLLAAEAENVEIWHTTYEHRMDSPAAIVDWLRATGLRPFLEPLSEPERTEFLREYEARITTRYPPRADGRRLLAFPRRFIVAQRRI